MRIILCDDEDSFSEQLKEYLEIFFDNNKIEQPVIDIFDNGEMLLKDTGNKDIVFLDVEMPGLSGIHIGNELKKYNLDIIIFIVTSYSEYLDKACFFQSHKSFIVNILAWFVCAVMSLIRVNVVEFEWREEE